MSTNFLEEVPLRVSAYMYGARGHYKAMVVGDALNRWDGALEYTHFQSKPIYPTSLKTADYVESAKFLLSLSIEVFSEPDYSFNASC